MTTTFGILKKIYFFSLKLLSQERGHYISLFIPRHPNTSLEDVSTSITYQKHLVRRYLGCLGHVMWRRKRNKKAPHATTSHGQAAVFRLQRHLLTARSSVPEYLEVFSDLICMGMYFWMNIICIIMTCIYGSIYLLRHHVVFACCNMEMESNSEFQWVVYQCWFFKLWVFPMRPLQHSTSIRW